MSSPPTRFFCIGSFGNVAVGPWVSLARAVTTGRAGQRGWIEECPQSRMGRRTVPSNSLTELCACCSAGLLRLRLICPWRNKLELKRSRARDPVEWSFAPNTETPLALIGRMRLSRNFVLRTAGTSYSHDTKMLPSARNPTSRPARLIPQPCTHKPTAKC